jgi:phosphodiesterase/alkaline phosphatase D-like protein
MITRKTVWGILLLIGPQAFSQVVRQPYLQVLTPTSIVVRWNTGDSMAGTVHYGPALETLTNAASESEARMFHQVLVTGLTPDTKYYYSIDTLA